MDSIETVDSENGMWTALVDANLITYLVLAKTDQETEVVM
jgi:hypothetical protein